MTTGVKNRCMTKAVTHNMSFMHILSQPWTDIWHFDTCSCLHSSVKAILFIRLFPHHSLQSSHLIPVQRA